MDQSLGQDYPVYSNSFNTYSNGVSTQSGGCDIPETMFMAFPQQRPVQNAQQCGQHIQQNCHQNYQPNQQHFQQQQNHQQPNQQHHQHRVQQQQQHHVPRQTAHQQPITHHEIHHQQQYHPDQHHHHRNQQQMHMNQQYAHHNNPQGMSAQQHIGHPQEQIHSSSSSTYPASTMPSAHSFSSPAAGSSSTALNYSSTNYSSLLPAGASLLNPAQLMFMPKPEPPTYPTMTGEHMTFAQLAAQGHSQGGTGFSGNSQTSQQNGSTKFSPNSYTPSTYTQSYRDSYESGSPESGNSSSPPAANLAGDSESNMGMYSGSPNVSPPRGSYGYGVSTDSYVPSATSSGMGSDPYVYPPTDCPPYPIPQIKTENTSPCSTPTPHQSFIDPHPYARPSPGSSPRVCRRGPMEPNSSVGSSPQQGTSQGSPGSSRRAHVLPPCKVCGVQATGFHYGVNTCEACKGFFRRSIIRKEEYTCLKSSKCIIEPGKRNLCGHCRYNKCIEAGMSVEGIKTGRYTYQKRTKDILELQQLKKEMSEARNQETKRMKELQTHELLAKVIDVAKKHPEVVNYQDILQMQQKYLEEKQMLTDLFGKMDRVNAEDYVYALENLGLELDDRREITNQLIEEMNIRMPILYAVLKELPGFEQINYNDSINLFKFSYIDIWLVARARMFNLSEGIFTTPEGTSFDFATVFGQNAADIVQKLVVKLGVYNFTVEEKILLVGVVYLSTDRVFLQLEDRETIDRVREMYIEALEISLPGNHPDVEHIFAKTLQILADLRTITQTVYNGLKGLLKYTNAKKYPLVHDILTVR